jgi:DNA polymerase-4
LRALPSAAQKEHHGCRPTGALWGIGSRTAKKLAELGLRTVAELARADPDALAERFGPKMGPYFWLLANGAGDTEVSDTPYVPRSRSREVTFQEDLTDPAELAEQVRLLARHVARDVAEEGRPAARIGVKIRYAPFITKTRSLTLPAPTSSAEEIERAALEVLGGLDLEQPVRLLGVRAEFGAG